MPRFAVLDCEDAAKWSAHEKLWIAALGQDDDEWLHFRCWAGELPPASGEVLSAFDGFVVTGSHHDAYSDLPWVVSLAAFLKKAVEQGRPRILGACFGCQLLARALGGSVGRNPSGRFVVGCERYVLCEQELGKRADWRAARAACRPVAGEHEARTTLRVLTSHGDAVLALPPHAVALASSPTTRFELWSLGDNVFAQQGHPEMSPSQLKEKILPGLVDKKRVTADEAAAAAVAAEGELDAGLLLAMGRAFLRGGDGAHTPLCRPPPQTRKTTDFFDDSSRHRRLHRRRGGRGRGCRHGRLFGVGGRRRRDLTRAIRLHHVSHLFIYSFNDSVARQ